LAKFLPGNSPRFWSARATAIWFRWVPRWCRWPGIRAVPPTSSSSSCSWSSFASEVCLKLAKKKIRIFTKVELKRNICIPKIVQHISRNDKLGKNVRWESKGVSEWMRITPTYIPGWEFTKLLTSSSKFVIFLLTLRCFYRVVIRIENRYFMIYTVVIITL